MKAQEELFGSIESYIELLLEEERGYSTFNSINQAKRDDLMKEKSKGHQLILGTIGEGAHRGGDSGTLSPTLPLNLNVKNRLTYTYIGIDNYYRKYVMDNDKPVAQKDGAIGKAYSERINLYHDEQDGLKDKDDSLRITNDICGNSLLSKTKKLFRDKKIRTIISSFHTSAETINDGDAKTLFALSHGRNLLKRDVEKGSIPKSPNGNAYDNPYCRVWTHHYQYDSMNKLIRPFVDENGNGKSLKDMHTWTDEFTDETSDYNWGYGWKNDNERWDYSVLNPNGHVNIAPKVRDGVNSLHTKQCMFSIENLAWKGMSPFEFERNLSWEQRGPMGGRIMWFPPYGISFQETTTAQWNSHSFIGRGEDVYTYVNTKRTGSLSFLMVVDHPSVTDYSTWYRKPGDVDDDLTETDMLRFFAGCDTGDATDDGSGGGAYSLFSKTKPPKYLEHESGTPVPVPPTEEKKEEEPKIEEKVEAPAEVAPTADVVPVVEEVNPISITFYVFYPNNYSGVYDLPNPNVTSEVDFAAYLINGVGTNKAYKAADGGLDFKDSPSMKTADVVSRSVDVPIDSTTYSKLEEGNGYEIYINSSKGIGKKGDGNVGVKYVPIHGTTATWQSYGTGKKVYPKTTSSAKMYHYRADGMYSVPKSKNDPAYYMNTYDDQLITGNYEDTASYGYNSSLGYEQVKAHYNESSDVNGENCLYAFTEVVAALYYGSNGKTLVDKNIADESRVAKLVDIFKNYEILAVNGFGSASSDARSAAAKRNQDNLNKSRYESVQYWLRNAPASPFTKDTIEWRAVDNDTVSTVKNPSNNVSTEIGKLGRFAKIVITAKATANKNLSETLQTTDVVTPSGKTSEASAETAGQKTISVTDENGNAKLATVEQKQAGVQQSISYQWTEEDIRTKASPVTLADYTDLRKKGYTHDEALAQVIRYDTMYATDSEVSDDDIEASVVRAMRPSIIQRDMKVETVNVNLPQDRVNYLRYDQEFNFFKELKTSDPVIFKNLIDKLQYFDPAFHSMTPEGFNGRLAFLHQCTRQGNTVSASDQAGQATNLAFGRPPICVLRLGDFYNQMIVIDSISMTYDQDGGVQWDLNPEGNGVQPLLAHITISFSFIGGGDMYGPIRRLQNAMTFNYYANQGLYDNRSDYEVRHWDHQHADSHMNSDMEGTYDNIIDSYHYLPVPDGERMSNNYSGEPDKNK